MTPRVTEEWNRWLPTLVAALLLFVGTVVPLPRRQNASFGPLGPDKLGHAVGHFGLTAVFLRALGEGRPDGRSALAAVLLSLCFGTCTELLQEAVPGRGFERADVFAGVVGSLLGVLLATGCSE
ncbi:VanZ family protein [Halobium salinum]|uniref:VanZ family protein n=1 Tax=Halobium salinum TaxID=1364940 RepID=A0ABD5PHN8_9EURY|nr:VanZ family protein [Halobium salinum]